MKEVRSMDKVKAMRRFGLALIVMGLLITTVSLAGSAMAQDHDSDGSDDMRPIGIGLLAIASGIAIGFTGYATSKAQADIGSAAVGAVAEDPSLFGKGLTLVVIPETIVIFGLIVALILLFVTVGQI
jgi:V/A-type H+-transporting ATPase subunit K